MSLMKNIAAKFNLLTILMVVGLVFAATNASAASIDSTNSSAVQALNGICSVDVAPRNGELRIFSVAVKCFENLINGIAEQSIIDFSEFLREIVYAMLMLYVIFYGAKVALGFTAVDKFKSEFFISALKIGFVGWLVFSFGLVDIYYLVLGAYHSLIQLVLTNADYGECSAAGATAGALGTGTDAIWATMDCQFTRFIGWEQNNGYTGPSGTPWTGVPLLFGYISSKFLPANGFIIGGFMFTVLWTLMMSFFRLAFVYMLSMIALILLFSISPLMIPMMLFQQTKAYFDGWYKLIISMVLQPVILFTFFSFIAALIADTVAKMKEVFGKMEPSFEVQSEDRLGQWTNPNQVFDMVGNFANNVDQETLMQGITTLVIAYLLISFINFVSNMALELSGFSTAPNLSGMATFGK